MYDQSDFDMRECIESNWESFIESDESDWMSGGVVEQFDPETMKLLKEF